MDPPAEIEYRPADDADLDAIDALIQPFAAERKLLPRTREDIAALIPTGFTALDEGSLIGFAAIEIYSSKLAEVLCLAVSGGYQGRGVGKQLVAECISLARSHDVREVMAISSAERFLRDCGFNYSLPDEKRALFYQLRPRH